MINPIETTLSAVTRVAELLRAGKSNSLTSFTNPTRVEPIVLVESSLREVPLTKEALLTSTSLFAGYYLQAAQMKINIGSIDTVRLLDQLSTNRSVGDAAAARVTQLSYTDFLPDFSNEEQITQLALAEDADPVNRSARFGQKTVETAYDVADLSVGKLLELNIRDGDHEASIPIAIRLMVNSVRSTALVAMMSEAVEDRGFIETYHGVMSGRLNFIDDVLLARDAVKAHRNILRADDTGTVREIMKRKQKGRLSGILSGQPSLNTVSSIAVISDTTRKAIERKSRKKLSRFKDRQAIMNELSLIFLIVIDTEEDFVTIYHDDIAVPSELTESELKRSNKGNGPDVTEILKTYLESSAPRL